MMMEEENRGIGKVLKYRTLSIIETMLPADVGKVLNAICYIRCVGKDLKCICSLLLLFLFCCCCCCCCYSQE